MMSKKTKLKVQSYHEKFEEGGDNDFIKKSNRK